MSTADSANATRRLVDIVRLLVAATLGLIGAAAGFTHTHDWAVHHGQTGWIAWADAVVIEGIVIVAGFEVQRDHRTGRHRRFSFPLGVLVAGFGVQMTAQVALAEPTPAGWLVAAMPALGFLVVVKLLMRRAPDEPAPATPPAPAPAEPAPAAMPAEAETAPAPPVRPAARLKLPPEIASRVHAAADAARDEGRDLTADDIRRVARVPDAMAARIVADLTGCNGHPVTA
ncbi:uncharacterized protein DUF2637 [Amycolatopsis echigonensis]|uniref:Uncharacterized protein DUF2637 n=1 Tax=Amycolatopsis echigonensis TaxID=2576905 RepID=A0A2N3WUZ8_9PSEU|nr:DUF2637 domain-containing protein [Amycolatopsis niigatensis]PKV97700.1 uncharacterized protein DUF2637 [Amycolatopsis niigatensis]